MKRKKEDTEITRFFSRSKPRKDHLVNSSSERKPLKKENSIIMNLYHTKKQKNIFQGDLKNLKDIKESSSQLMQKNEELKDSILTLLKIIEKFDYCEKNKINRDNINIRRKRLASIRMKTLDELDFSVLTKEKKKKESNQRTKLLCKKKKSKKKKNIKKKKQKKTISKPIKALTLLGPFDNSLKFKLKLPNAEKRKKNKFSIENFRKNST